MTPEEVKKLYGNDVIHYGYGKNKVTTAHRSLVIDEQSLGGYQMERRAMPQGDAHDYYKIQTRGTRWSRLVVPDRSNPILMDGDISQQVGGFWVEGDEAFLRFSRSEKGQKARSAFARGELQPHLANLGNKEGGKPCAIALRASSRSNLKDNDMSDAQEMLALGQRHNRTELAIQAVQDGKSLKEFRTELLDDISTEPLKYSAPAIHTSGEREFSITKAIQAEVDGDWNNAGYEREMCQEARRNFVGTPRGLVVPTQELMKRTTMLTSGDVSGAIGTQLRPDLMIDALRPLSVVMDAGATMLSGLSSNVAIPKVNGDLSAAFVAENTDATESDLDIDTITMTPTRVSGTSSFSREVLYTAQPDIDQMVRRILGERIALTIDDAALEGSGSGAIPTGILNTTGVNTKATAGSSTMTHAESLDVIAAVQADNVDTAGAVWVAHPTDLATLGAQAVDSGSGRFVYDNGQIGGYRVLTSTQVTAGKLYFGRFSDLLVGMWGGTDIIVDPYTNAKKAVIAITASQMVDVNVRHPQSFNVVTLTS